MPLLGSLRTLNRSRSSRGALSQAGGIDGGEPTPHLESAGSPGQRRHLLIAPPLQSRAHLREAWVSGASAPGRGSALDRMLAGGPGGGGVRSEGFLLTSRQRGPAKRQCGANGRDGAQLQKLTTQIP